MISTVKPLPAPHVPGKTEFERFDNAMRQVLTVTKEELLRREHQERQEMNQRAASQRKAASEQREMADAMRSKRRPKR